MKYFSYLSQDKIDQFLSNFEEYEKLEITEGKGAENKFEANAGISGIISMIKAGLTYGRSDTFVKNVKLRETYVQKLGRLLELLQETIEPFDWDNPLRLVDQFYSTTDVFVVSSINKEFEIARLVNKKNDRQLYLDCSLKYFSSNSDFSKPLHLNSTNFGFFNDGFELVFETLFFITSKKNNTVFASPVFLLMTSQDGLII